MPGVWAPCPGASTAIMLIRLLDAGAATRARRIQRYRGRPCRRATKHAGNLSGCPVHCYRISTKGAVQAAEGECHLDDVGTAWIGRRLPTDVADPPQPVAHGVGMHEQRASRRLQRATRIEEGGYRVEQDVAGLGQRPVDVVDELV